MDLNQEMRMAYGICSGHLCRECFSFHKAKCDKTNHKKECAPYAPACGLFKNK